MCISDRYTKNRRSQSNAALMSRDLAKGARNAKSRDITAVLDWLGSACGVRGAVQGSNDSARTVSALQMRLAETCATLSPVTPLSPPPLWQRVYLVLFPFLTLSAHSFTVPAFSSHVDAAAAQPSYAAAVSVVRESDTRER